MFGKDGYMMWRGIELS